MIEEQYIEVQLFGWDREQRKVALDWCRNTFDNDSFSVAMFDNLIYFENESDATMFIMKWS